MTVFFISIALVNGPTPPGTGVSAPATVATAGIDVADEQRALALELETPRRGLGEPACNERGIIDAVHPDIDHQRHPV